MLSASDLMHFEREGFLLFPGLFSPAEVAALRAPLQRLVQGMGPDTYWEPEDTRARIVFGLHDSDEVYADLCSHPRLLHPVERLLDDQVHILQSRVNFKPAFSTVNWTWHQDYNQWYLMDGMRRPSAVLVGVFLDEATACNGPLLVIPGSHQFGHRPIPIQKEGLSKDLVSEMAGRSGVRAMLGPPGTVMFLNALTVHGSTANMSPESRSIFYCAYNALSNTPIPSTRHPSRCGHDYRPLRASAENSLLRVRATLVE